MEDKGWIILNRNITESEFWLKEPFTRAQAWIDIILFTNYKESSFYVRDNQIIVKRGQFAWSERKLAKRWKWSQRKVQNFLKLLQKTGKIESHKNNVLSCYTVLNYDKYQTRELTRNSQETHKKLNKNKVKESINININTNGTNENSPLKEYIQTFNRLFKRDYRATTGRKDRLAARLKTFTLEQILKAVENLSKSKFHQGDNDRNWVADPDFLIRNDEQIDKWLQRINSVNGENNYKKYEDAVKNGDKTVW